MYVHLANFHVVTANQTGLVSNFFDQSLAVAHAYNFKYQLNKLNQLKVEIRGSPIRIIKQREGVHPTLAPHIITVQVKSRSILRHGSVGATLKQNKRNLTLTLTLNVLLPSIVFHNEI